MALNAEQKNASIHTKRIHDDVLKNMNLDYLKIEDEDTENYRNHFILSIDNENFTDEEGNIIWNRNLQTALTAKEYPDTVNPYLWRAYQNGYPAGVVKFKDGFYGVFGIDSSPIGFVRSKTGWIIQDCGNTVSAAEIALKLVEKATGEKIYGNVRAVIYSHTHRDHINGVIAFVSPDQVGTLEEGKVPVIAPIEWEQSLVDDNLYAGIAMSRRLQYQCGLYLQPDEKGWVSIGLSSNMGVKGTASTIMPTMLVDNGTIEIDGVKLTFILAPNTETRAHMCTYFDDYKVLYLGDVSVGTIHNTYTMRGAPVRDANYWGKVFYQLYLKYGEKVEAIYQGHGLPHFKLESRPDNLKKYLLDNAVSYKYTHDQALLLANEGYPIQEIGNSLEIPESISRTWYTRQHYGSYSFNARGTIQKYLGFYNGNPVNLLPLPERELAEKLISYIGSEDLVLQKALEDYEKGEYQWVATITSHLVYHNPENQDARYLCADAFEQLGYQAENALWRCAYLTAALDLRHPEFSKNLNIRAMDNASVIPFVSVELLLDHLGINFDGSRASETDEKYLFIVELDENSDKEEEYHIIHIYKGTVLHERLKNPKEADAIQSVNITKGDLYLLAIKKYQRKPEKDPAGEDIIEKIQQYVVDTSVYKNFSLIEPIEQLR